MITPILASSLLIRNPKTDQLALNNKYLNMKTKFLKTLLLAVFTTVFFTGCVDDDSYNIPTLECNEPNVAVTKTVAQIYNAASMLPVLYEANDVIEARVVSSDKGGNFFKTIFLISLDGEIGFSVAANQTDLFTEYGVGRKVYIKLQGLYIQIRSNTLQIGALFNGNVGQIATTQYRNAMKRSCDIQPESTFTNELTLSEVNDSNLGKLVAFSNVQFTDDSLNQNYYNPSNVLGGATNLLITDATGATVIFRTGSFAEYAGLSVLSGSGTIIGVLTKFGSTYQFVSRYTTDIQLTEPRIGGEPIDPVDPIDPVNPVDPPEPTTGGLFFTGGNFQDFPGFVAGLNSFGIKSYAVASAGNGIDGSTALKITTTTTGNDFVFTAKAIAGIPANPTKITFFVRGTGGKSLSLNVYRSTTGYDAFNVGDLGSAAVTINKAELNSSGNGSNQYTGTINTNNQWVKVTLNISNVAINTTVGNDIFALKIGSNVPYDIYFDNFFIE